MGMGSRIIPMSQDILGDFGKGNSVSQTAERTGYRSMRRLRERFLLRRERLHRVLHVLNFLPTHYASQIDFDKRFGKFKAETEPKLVYNSQEFIFKKSFEEMLADFEAHQPQILIDKNGQPALVPYDWTIYFLRKKALTNKIAKEELAWILLNFNQKRGYYQLRGEEEEETPDKLVAFHSLRIVDVIADEPQKGKTDTWYSLVLENGWVYRRASKTPLFDWKDKVRDFIVTTDLNEDGSIKTDKDGKAKRSFRAPSETDWTLIKKKTEQEIDQSHKTVGAYIYDTLLQNPKQKINGKLVRTIERKFYKKELKQILEKQVELQPELFTNDLLNDCIRELYRNNEAQQEMLQSKDFVHLFLEDIIFYQRPLRSQKSSISNCTLEYYQYKDKDGVLHTQYLKAIPKSNPYYQEFRLWQWMYNLSIYRKADDLNVTQEYLNTIADWEKLFDFLNSRKEVNHTDLLHFLLEPKLRAQYPHAKPKAFKDELSKAISKYRWNYVFDDSKEKEEEKSKKYPCNETRTLIASRLDKVTHVPADFLTGEVEQQLWHLLYSVTDKTAYEKALKSFARKNNLDEPSFFEAFKKFPPFKSEYGSFSEKAIKKLLPLMRLGKYWRQDDIVKNNHTYFYNIEKLLDNLAKKEAQITDQDRQEWNKDINQKLRDELEHFRHAETASFQGLRLHIAQYLVYGRHSEAAIAGKWNSAADLEQYLKEFKQHALRNPIVEQVVTETLRVVKDIWLKYGNGAKDFFSEIHVELGREMKQTKDERADATKRITENENTNLRIKALLAEMVNDSSVENVRPFSPMQQEILKIYEEGVLHSDIEIEEDILKISKTAQPSPSDLKRYKLWLEQKYKSPYTGKIIPLNKLFTPEYEIEHIIPQSRYFDDSFSNKVICEAAVNKLKDNNLGLEFIKKFQGQQVVLGSFNNGIFYPTSSPVQTVKIFSVTAYDEFVKQHYAKDRSKRTKLLLEDIPEKMIARQMNDTRYISKFISGLLSNIVRSDNNDDGVNSKNLIPFNGKITSELKNDWGLNDVWNDLILPRFERMNQITNSTHFTAWNERYQKHLPTVPIEVSRNFQKKRIDHRHHALDALVIACATKDHVNLLNNESAKSDTKRYDLKRKLMSFEKVLYKHPQTGERIERNIPKQFLTPWENFTVEAKNTLVKIIVSFKQNLRVINKATNYYEKYVEKYGVKIKERIAQVGTNWAIRKSLHEETVSGKIELQWVETSNGEFITATRKSLDSSFNIEKIGKITDTGIQKILKNYLKAKHNNPELAFSPEGIEDFNKNIEKYNEGKFHQPIIKVRVYEKGKGRFALGQTGNKVTKYVQGSPNVFFAVYKDENEKKTFETIRLDVVIERLKQGLKAVPETNLNGAYLYQSLSPLDLVYIPTEDEIESPKLIDFSTLNETKLERIYNVNDFSGGTIYFSQNSFAKNIYPKEMDMTWNEKKQKLSGSFDSKTASFNKKSIKEIFIKLKVDRLGNISKA